MTEKRLTWDDATDRISFAYNSKNECVGHLMYELVGRHMHWCWYQNQEFRMSPGCLQEVRDKQKELFKKIRG